MLPLFSINWNPSTDLVNLFGVLPIHYYSLMWLIGLVFAYFIVRREYIDRQIDNAKFEPLFFYCLISMLIGSRMGHCIFYDWAYYQNHLLEMILPVKIMPDGEWHWTGYRGLASHGGTLGLIIGLALYCYRNKMHFVDVLDMIAVATPITACCIRLGNLMNSEIIGKPSDVPWAFVFEQVDNIPRHPAQLYEAIAYFIFFLGMIWLYKRGQKKTKTADKPRTDFSKSSIKKTENIVQPYPRGFYFGLCLTEIFAFRFFIEFLKENQVEFEDSMELNMGQWLSVPFVLVGIYFMCFYGKGKKA